MTRQLPDQAYEARAKLFVMLVQWCLARKWPKFRNAPVSFLDLILEDGAARRSFRPEVDFPVTPLP